MRMPMPSGEVLPTPLPPRNSTSRPATDPAAPSQNSGVRASARSLRKKIKPTTAVSRKPSRLTKFMTLASL